MTPERPSSRRARLAIALFFLISGGVLLWFAALEPLTGIIRARSWVPATCEITHSSVDDLGGARRAYKWRAGYRYQFGGRAWTGDRTTFFEAFTSRDGQRKLMADNPPGSRVPCFVDPEAPEQAVIDRGPSWRLLWALLPLLLLLFGAAALASPVREEQRS